MPTAVATSPENSTILDLSSIYGLVLLGILLSWIFWGISCMQIYDSDPYYLQLLVIFLWSVTFYLGAVILFTENHRAVETVAGVVNFIPCKRAEWVLSSNNLPGDFTFGMQHGDTVQAALENEISVTELPCA
ncbi:hypothetical protein Clacol_002431 [Clathrus columnatus]|uniref:Uncharacterized protein n=1 Tax=Clathrus columnatus TaxID=1419009 RepID=A0AAV5A0S5_9AGAM|nr:hypothetical protein Clacol_002431 [Clathrus columnatus]